MLGQIPAMMMAMMMVIMLLGTVGNAADWIDPLDETKAQRDARMHWWREAKFGMFIHWGVYAVPAGTYQGKQIPGIGEWIMRKAHIPVSEYKAYAKEFDPVKYDPDAWAKLAKEAGMKYIVITSKHHDGFALYDSKVTDWDVVDATPYGKDLLEPLVKAAHEEGLKMGFYYSQAQDWNHPGGAKSGYKEGRGWDDMHQGSFDEYLKSIAYPQVKEILTRYDLDILWWDTPVWMTKERAELLRPLIQLRPGLITNNRLGGGYRGDTDTPEQHIPATGIPGRDWEVCMTMNRTWGYKSYDNEWKSVEDLIQKLCDIVSKGGNFLLNIGPKADGTIPDESIERLKAVGRWMNVNGEAIYATQASPFRLPKWGRCTRKRLGDGRTRLFLHVFHWPADGKLTVQVSNKVSKCYLLADAERTFTTTANDEGLVVRLTGDAPDAVCSVVVLDIEGEPQVTAQQIEPMADGSLLCPAELADLHNPGYGEHARIERKYGKPNIGYWFDPRAWIQWPIKVAEAGTYEVTAIIATPSRNSKIKVEMDKQKLTVAVNTTGGYETFKPQKLCSFNIEKAGIHSLSVKPVKEGWEPINLQSVVIRPVR